MVLFDALTSFSSRPLYMVFAMGMATSLLALLLSIVTVMRYLTVGSTVAGWYSVFLSVWFFGGLLTLNTGLKRRITTPSVSAWLTRMCSF